MIRPLIFNLHENTGSPHLLGIFFGFVRWHSTAYLLGLTSRPNDTGMIELRDTKAEVHHGHFLLCQQQCNGDYMYSRSVIDQV